MTLSDEYLRQLGFRPWAKVMDSLPPLHGKTVLDLGCAVGDQAALLAARGARVIGIDGNPELLETARSRGIPSAEFRHGYLHALDETEPADGIWCSFAVAYFTDFAPILGVWKQRLKPGGWIALTEIDELFGHEPVNAPPAPCWTGTRRPPWPRSETIISWGVSSVRTSKTRGSRSSPRERSRTGSCRSMDPRSRQCWTAGGAGSSV
jgi:2-polyprenyl-3-methyl-5-hydroxy-6-metoxy-1,4-benzoquinol methylase